MLSDISLIFDYFENFCETYFIDKFVLMCLNSVKWALTVVFNLLRHNTISVDLACFYVFIYTIGIF